MDMLKKARGKAMAAVKEVQTIIQTPGQQATTYQTSSSQNQAPYQQYGQQYPQVQAFQSQYTAPAPSYPQGQPQHHYAGGNQHVPANQYSQYTAAPGGQQSPGIGGQFNQNQYGHNPHHPQQQTYSGPAPHQQPQVLSSQSQPQYGTALPVPPAYSPPTNVHQPQPVGGVQGTQYSSSTPQQHGFSPPIHQQPAQPYQQPLNSPPLGHFQSTSQQYQMASPPIQQFNQTQFTAASPPVQQSPYSAPSQTQQNHQGTPLQHNIQQPGYFPPVGENQNYQQNHPSQQQASNFMQNFITQNQTSGMQSPPLPLGRPQQSQNSPSPHFSQAPPLQSPSPQQIIRPSQSPALPPRKDISSPPTPAPPLQQFNRPSQSPPQTMPLYSSPRPTEGHIPPSRQDISPQEPSLQHYIRPSQSPTPPSYPSKPSQEQMPPSRQEVSSPVPQTQHLQHHTVPPQGPIHTALPYSSTRPVDGQTVPSKQGASSPSPVQQFNKPTSNPSSNSSSRYPSPRPIQPQKLPFIQGDPTVPSQVPQISPNSQPSLAQVPLPYPSDSPIQAQTLPLKKSGSLSGQSSPLQSGQAIQLGYSSHSPRATHANLPPQPQLSQTQVPPRQHSISPPPLKQYHAFGQTTAQSPVPGYISQPKPQDQGRVSPINKGPLEGQYQAFHRTPEGSSVPPVPIFSYSQQSAPPRHETVSPPIVERYQAFQKTQSPVSGYSAFKPPTSGSDHVQILPPKVTSPAPETGSPSQSPFQRTPQFPPPSQGQLPPSNTVSPQSQYSSLAFGNQQLHRMPTPPQGQTPEPVKAHPTISPLSPTHRKADSFPPQVFELDSGPHISHLPQDQAQTPPVPQARPSFSSNQSGPIEYADGLIAVEHENSNYAPPVQKDARNYKPAVREVIPHRTSKTKCAGFEPTLTDTNQFFEVQPAIMKQYSISFNEGSELAICEYCFHTFILPHPWLASIFRPRPKRPTPEDKYLPQISFERMIGCGIAFPRIRQVILGQTVPQSNIQPFLEYARLDATLPPCSGEPQLGGYYGTKAIESLAVCTSCYECYIKNTAFERYFELMHGPPEQQWGCDVGYAGYIHRILLFDIAKNPPDFGHFVTESNKRLAMPPCTGHKQQIAASGPRSSIIFRSVNDNCGVFCSGCFHDQAVGTPAEQNFGYEIEIDDDQKSSLSCDLSFPFSKDAMTRAVKARNFEVWHGPIVAGNTTRLCPSLAGHDEGDLAEFGNPNWYCFRDYPQIEVCARCYGMQIVVAQAEELFVPITRAHVPGRIRQCYLSPTQNTASISFHPMDYENTTAWRGQYLRNVIEYGLDAGGDFTIAKQAAAKIALLPPPCGSELRKFKPASGRKFFGHQASNSHDPNDATIIICEECHLYSVKGTQMEGFFSNDLTKLAYSLSPDGHRCSTWSKQCKSRLRTACETNNFAAYAQYHHKREDVYNKLWQSMRELEPLNTLLQQHVANINRQTEMNIQMGALRLAQQMNAQQNALMMGIGGSMAEAAASDTGYRYGNSTVGTGYLTAAGANAAMAQHDAANMPGLNLVVWQNASTERLTAEVTRRLEIQDALRLEWQAID